MIHPTGRRDKSKLRYALLWRHPDLFSEAVRAEAASPPLASDARALSCSAPRGSSPLVPDSVPTPAVAGSP